MISVAGAETIRQGSIVKLVGTVCILSAPVWVYKLFFPFPEDFPLDIQNQFAPLLIVLFVMLLLAAVLVHRLSAGDRFLAEVMMVGYLLKLAAVSAYLLTVVHLYEGVGDLFLYYSFGLEMVKKHALTGEWTALFPFWSTNFIVMLTSRMIYVFGESFQGLMVIYATIAYWGQYLFYRAYCIAFPGQQRRTAALFMFLLPSLAFWTATIGKDAIIFFFIGGCCYGFARMTKSSSPAALATILVSLGGVMLVRPHVAGMLAISFGGAYLLTRNSSGALGVAAKSIGVPILLVAGIYFVAQARKFVDLTDVDQTKHVLEHAGEVNLQQVGTKFGASLIYRLMASPFLLFRPFFFEVRNPQMAVAALEGFGLLIFFWRRREVARPSLRRCREDPFFLFLWLYLLEFSVLFAGAMTNFGVLARQRDMLIPSAVMIFLSRPGPGAEALKIPGINRTAGFTYRSLRPQSAAAGAIGMAERNERELGRA